MRKVKFIISVLLVLSLLCSLCACSSDKDDPSQQIINYNIDNEPVTLDPQVANDSGARLVILNIFEGLIRLDGNDMPILGAAKSYASNPTSTSFTFALRDDIKWSNGEKVTANDFVYGIQRALLPETGSDTASTLFCIKNAEKFNKGKAKTGDLGVTAIDESTILFELEYSNADFPRLLATPPTMPCNEKFFKETKGQYGRESDMIISNGPFAVRSAYGWEHGDNIKLRANENYTGENAVVPAGVDITIGNTPKNAYDAISNGTLDCYALNGDDVASAKANGFTIKSYDDTTWGLCFNLKDDTMKNENIRKAFITSLNRSYILDSIPERFKPTGNIIPDSAMVGDKSYRSVAGGDMYLKQSDNAKKLFAEGMSELEISALPQIEILCLDDSSTQQMVNNMIETWNKNTGYYFNKKPLSRGELEDAVSSGDYQLALAPLKSNGISPSDTLELFRSNSSGNIAGLESGGYDKLLDIISGSSDSDSIETVIKAEKYLNNHAIFYPLCTESRYYASAPNVTNVIFHQYGAEVDFTLATKVPQ